MLQKSIAMVTMRLARMFVEFKAVQLLSLIIISVNIFSKTVQLIHLQAFIVKPSAQLSTNFVESQTIRIYFLFARERF